MRMCCATDEPAPPPALNADRASCSADEPAPPSVTQGLQHPADPRFSTLAAADAQSDADGDEPPENDPSPPGGKRRPSAGGNGDDAMRWNVGTQPSNTQGAAARVTGVTPTTPTKRTRQASTKQEPKQAPKQTPKQEPKRVNAGRSQSETEDLREARMAAARTILAQDPDISIRPFTRRIAMITHVPIDLHTAYTILVELTGRKPKSKTAEAAERAKAATASE